MAVISRESRTGGKLPRGPHRFTSDQVADDQRQRLIGAMLSLSEKRGYTNTTVADIIDLAEVSRKTFYEHFADRDSLLLATFDATSSAVLEEVRTASQRTGGPTRQMEALMNRLCRIVRERPAAVMLSTIEVAAVAVTGLDRRENLMDDYGTLIDECLRADGEPRVLSPVLARILVGGIHRTIDAYVRSGQTHKLQSLAPELARWTRSHYPIPPSLATSEVAKPSWGCAGTNGLVGGRAPGTLTLAPDGYEPPSQVRSSGFVHHSNRERILDAVAQLTATHGYAALTALSITERADISERAFLAHFKNKDEAFAATVEIGHIKGQAIVERARAGASDWRTGVSRAIHALLEFLASEPYFTRLAFIDAPLAGPAMTHRTHQHAVAYSRLLLAGAPQRRRPPGIAPEATVHGLFELAFDYAARSEVQELPHVAREATYLALAPYVGVTEAAESAA